MASHKHLIGLRLMAAALLLTSNLAAGPGLAASPAAVADDTPPGLRLLDSQPGEIVIELTVGDYAVEDLSANGETYQRLTLPEAELNDEAGAPQVPVRAALLGVPTLAGLSVSVLEADAESLTGLRLYPTPVLVAPETAFEAEPSAAPAEVFAPDAAIYGADQDYPGRLADLGESGYLRDQAVAQIRFYPLQYNPVTGAARLYHRLVVRLTWDSNQVSAAATRPESAAVLAFMQQTLLNAADLPPASGRALSATETNAPSATDTGTLTEPGQAITPSLKISVTATGLYQLTYAQITSAGFNLAGVDPRTIKIKLHGSEVAIRVQGEGDGIFDATDYVLFYGERYEDIYTLTNIYWLEAGGANGLRMAAQDGTPGGASVPTHFPAHVHGEVNQNYWNNMPNGTGQEHWFWGSLLSPNSGGFAVYRDYWDGLSGLPATCNCLTLQNLSATAVTATVKVHLRGFTTPSHRSTVSVNGTLVNTLNWNGQVEIDQTAVISHSLIISGSNVIRVGTVDIGSVPDQILVDWIEVDYWDRYVAENNALAFGTPAAGAQKFQVTAFTTNTVQIFNVTNPLTPAVISNAVITGAGPFTATFQATVTAGVKYLAVAPNQFKTPAGLVLDQPSNWRSPSNGADWIIITYEGFAASAQALANFRAGQGQRTALVKVQDVYDEFNDGLFNPQAIKSFLDYAFDNWQSPAPTYVVLLGDACQDYKNARYNQAVVCSRNYVPSQIYEASIYGQVPSDYWFTTFQGNDQFPDMFIGRLSAQDSTQAADIVNKIIAYETTPPSAAWNNHVTLVADDVDLTFATISDQLAAEVPAGYVINKIYAANFPPGSPPLSLASQINTGSLLVNYFGHGEFFKWGQWANGGNSDIFNQADISGLGNAGKYTVVTIGNCLNGLFNANDAAPAMAETWQRAANKGAVAVWAPTNIGYPSGHRLLMLAFYDALFTDKLYQLGAATAQASLTVLGLNSGYDELVATYLLFGDPATTLGLPSPYITSHTPANGATNVPRFEPLVVHFSQPMNPAQVAVSSVPSLVFTPLWSADNKVVTYTHPLYNLGAHIAVTITGSGANGQALGSGGPPNGWWFDVTSTTTPPSVTLGVERNSLGDIPRDAAMLLTFTAPITPATLGYTLAPAVAGQSVSWDLLSQVATLNHSGLFTPGGTYTLTANAATAMTGGTLITPTNLIFTVTSDGLAPGGAATIAGAPANVLPATPIVVTFTEAVRTTSVTYTLLPNVTLVPAWSGGGMVLTLTPAGGYSGAQAYVFAVTAAKDLAGNSLAAPFGVSFNMRQALYIPLVTR